MESRQKVGKVDRKSIKSAESTETQYRIYSRALDNGETIFTTISKYSTVGTEASHVQAHSIYTQSIYTQSIQTVGDRRFRGPALDLSAKRGHHRSVLVNGNLSH